MFLTHKKSYIELFKTVWKTNQQGYVYKEGRENICVFFPIFLNNAFVRKGLILPGRYPLISCKIFKKNTTFIWLMNTFKTILILKLKLKL